MICRSVEASLRLQKPTASASQPAGTLFGLALTQKGSTLSEQNHEVALPRRAEILGVPVSVVDMDTAVAVITRWIGEKKARYVCATEVNSVMRARDDRRQMQPLSLADLIIPDGKAPTWVMRLRRHNMKERVCGPELMLAVCKKSVSTILWRCRRGGRDPALMPWRDDYTGRDRIRPSPPHTGGVPHLRAGPCRNSWQRAKLLTCPLETGPI